MMGCTRAFDIDLVAFLAEPRAEAFADFRAHYPRCAVCAAEMRAWTELAEQLGRERHPAATALAEYASLPAQERAAIDRHAAGCARCREELRVLEAFDPALLTRPAPAAEPVGPGWLERLPRLFWHPAFAYGVALLVVAPVLWRTQGPGALDPLPGAADLASKVERVSEPMLGDARELTRAVPEPADREAAGREPFAQQAPARENVVHHVAQERHQLRKQAGAEGAGARADVVADAPGLHPAVDELREELAPEPAAAPPRAKAAARNAARAPEFAEAQPHAPALASGARVAMEADAAASEPPRLAPVALLGAPEQVSVRVPVRDAAHREVEVRVSDLSGERTLVQRAAATPERLEVAVELPRSWLTPGLYRVELRDGNAPVRTYALPVVER